MIRLPPLAGAVLWFSGTMLGFAGMAIATRNLHTGMSTFEILFFRSVVGLLVVLPFVARRRFAPIRTFQIKWHACRAVVQFAAQFCWVYGIVHLTLSDLTAIEFSIPLFTAVLAVIVLGERMWRHKWIATAVGFAGVLLILRPDGTAFNFAGLVMLTGSAFYAGSGILIKYLTRSDGAIGITFWMSLLQLPLGLAGAVLVYRWTTPVLADVPWILVWGCAGLLAQYAMARALALADITIVFPLDFLRLPFMALIGYLIYAETISPWTAVGAAVIFAANWYSIREEARHGGTPAGH